MTGECGSTGTASRPPRLVYKCTAPTYPYHHDPHRDYWYACSIILAKQIPKKKRKKKKEKEKSTDSNKMLKCGQRTWNDIQEMFTSMEGRRKTWSGWGCCFVPASYSACLSIDTVNAVVTVLEQRNNRIICCRKKKVQMNSEKRGVRGRRGFCFN